ncbi:MAG: hypothetical protein IJ190_10440 [Prevotella sp.]|nr:hypothetical protein [Prevotella sp.]
MVDAILLILQWAVPGGIGGTIVWLVDRKGRKAETAKKVHDAYRAMYEEVSQDLEKQREQYERLYKELEDNRKDYLRLNRSVNRLSRAVEAIQFCPYRTNCPVRRELRLSEESGGTVRDGKSRKSAAGHRRKGDGDKRDGTVDDRDSGTDSPGGEDIDASGGG